MAARTCWVCGTRTHMTLIKGSVRVASLTGRRAAWAAFVCDQCKNMSLGACPIMASATYTADELANRLDRAPDEDITWIPDRGSGKAFPDVPDEIASAGDEAYRCLSIGARRGAVMIARAVVEATAKHKGITSGRLVDKIDALASRGLIREHVREAAHEIRHLGNDMAHGDFTEAVATEDANQVLVLMSEILNEVFQSPARVAAMKAAREAKKAAE